MLRSYQILVSPLIPSSRSALPNRVVRLSLPAFATLGVMICAMGLSACGQTGALYLPTEAAAAQRATLPQTLKPGAPVNPSSATTPTQPALAK